MIIQNDEVLLHSVFPLKQHIAISVNFVYYQSMCQ